LRIRTFIPATAAAVALGALALGAAACSDDGGSEEDEAAIQAVVDNVNQAQLNGDMDLFLAQFTEQGLAEVFFLTPEEVMENPEELQIESEEDFVVIRGDIEVDGDTAEAIVAEPARESGFDSPFLIEFIKDGDVWKVDGGGAGDAEEPDGANTVALGLHDFGFDFDESEFVSGAPVVFEVENTGEQPHHFAMFKLDEGVVLEDALASEEEPEGVHEVGFSAPFQPGNEAKVSMAEDLEPGRYALLCFFGDTTQENPDDHPHFMMGMVREFEVS
jgi:hypothetical protein